MHTIMGNLFVSHSHKHASAYRGYRDPASTGLSHPFAMIFQMGTLESTKDRSWTWILAAPMETVQKAGVDFNPDTRSVTAIQGDAASGSALEAIVQKLIHCINKHINQVHV